MLVKEAITFTGAGDDAAARRADERNKGVVFKNCAPFTKCISKINDTQTDTSQDIDISNYNSGHCIVMRMYNLIEYSDATIIQKYLEYYGSTTKINQMIT